RFSRDWSSDVCSSDLIDDVMTAIKNASGPTFQAMIAASDGASQTLTNQWKIAKDNIVVALSEQLLPIIDSLTPAMRKFGEVAPRSEERRVGKERRSRR